MIDGKVEEEKLRNDEVFDEDYSRYNAITKFTMPAVTEGSVIEYTYKIKSPFLGSIGKTPLQYTIPINKLELEIEIPEFFGFSNYFNLRSPLKFKLENSSKTFSKSFTSVNRQSYSTRGRTKSASQVSKVEYKLNTYVINREDIPALKKEKHLDNLQNYAAYIDWELMYTKFPNSMVENLSTNWDGVAKSIYTDVGLKEELNRSGFYDEDLEAVIAGVSNPVMKIKKIFNFVKQKVSWNDYLGYSPESGVKKAYKEGSGNTADINILLVSMLKYAGVNAHPVLVSTASNGIPLFPTRNGFNYVIAGVELKDQLILLDASDPFSDIGELPGRARNWQGRIIREDGSSDWVNLSPTVHSQLRTQMNVRLSESGISGMHNNIYEGLFAKSFRDHFSTTNEASYIEQLRSGNTGLDVTEFSIENKNSIGKEITEKYDFSLENGVDVIGNKMYLNPLLFESLKENPFKSSERVYPIFFDFPEKRSKTVNILIPDSYKVVTLPESTIVNLSEGGGQFRYIVSH